MGTFRVSRVAAPPCHSEMPSCSLIIIAILHVRRTCAHTSQMHVHQQMHALSHRTYVHVHELCVVGLARRLTNPPRAFRLLEKCSSRSNSTNAHWRCCFGWLITLLKKLVACPCAGLQLSSSLKDQIEPAFLCLCKRIHERCFQNGLHPTRVVKYDLDPSSH